MLEVSALRLLGWLSLIGAIVMVIIVLLQGVAFLAIPYLIVGLFSWALLLAIARIVEKLTEISVTLKNMRGFSK